VAAVDKTQFAEAVLQGLGLPITPSNLEVMVAWENQEGGNWNNSRKYNPLNTTQKMPGASYGGAQGNIASYTSWDQGVAATVKTLSYSAYAGIRHALSLGNDPMAVASAVGASPWGTKGLAAALRGGAGKAVNPEPLGPNSPGAGGTAGTTASDAGFSAESASWWNPFTWGSSIERDVFKITVYGLFGLGGVTLVVLGLWRGVSPTVQKVQQMGQQAASTVAKAAAVA
jgi:hypothetical protein